MATTAVVKRIKNGATHYAAAVNGAGVVQSWSDAEAKAQPVIPELAQAMEAHYRGKRNAGTLVFVADGKEVGRIETPTDPPPSPGAVVELRAILGLAETAPSDAVMQAAVEELKAYRGTQEGPSPFVRDDASAEEVEQLRKELAEAKAGAMISLPTRPESVSLVVDDAALDSLIAGNSVTGFDAGVTITLTRPDTTSTDATE